MAHAVTRRYLRCPLLYGPSDKIPGCDGLDSAVEQVHSSFARTLQGHHHVSFHEACESRPAMLSRCHAHETFVAVRFHPPYAPRSFTVDPHPSP